jgi:hypothetical protein
MPRASQNLADFSELLEILFLGDHNQYVALQCVYSLGRNGKVFCHRIWLILKPDTVSDAGYYKEDEPNSESWNHSQSPAGI